MVQDLFSRDIDPLIIIDGRCMERAGATRNISYGTCEECNTFPLVKLKLISGRETPVTLPG